MPAKVHYGVKLTDGPTIPFCWGRRSFDSPTTRNTRKVTCKLCLRLLDSR